MEPFLAPRMIGLDALRGLAEAGDDAALLQWLLPLEAGLSHFGRVELDAPRAQRFCMGQRLRDPAWPGGLVAVFADTVQAVAEGTIDVIGSFHTPADEESKRLPFEDAAAGAESPLAQATIDDLPGMPITADQWKMLQRDNVVAADGAGLAAFGIVPTPMAAVAPQWLVRYRRHGRFTKRQTA